MVVDAVDNVVVVADVTALIVVAVFSCFYIVKVVAVVVIVVNVVHVVDVVVGVVGVAAAADVVTASVTFLFINYLASICSDHLSSEKSGEASQPIIQTRCGFFEWGSIRCFHQDAKTSMSK